ncbi:unnamed protein product [Adineta ricciae]|uniref:ABC transmembrane type-1 domain-containing protein n=1 Tax=Adineta ricciae TaxID=249248 RepID=A0A816FEP3_ADIRI|nr:unnamed protein product [Adineta ricciae]
MAFSSPELNFHKNIGFLAFLPLKTKTSISLISGKVVALEILYRMVYNSLTAFGGQHHERIRYEQSLADAKKAGLRKGLYLGISQAFVNISLYGAVALIFWYGPYLARIECWNYDAGVVMIIFTSCLFATNSISMFIPYIVAFIDAAVAGAKVFAVIDRKSPIDYTNHTNNQPHVVRGDIELRNVTFNYPARKEKKPVNYLLFSFYIIHLESL